MNVDGPRRTCKHTVGLGRLGLLVASVTAAAMTLAGLAADQLTSSAAPAPRPATARLTRDVVAPPTNQRLAAVEAFATMKAIQLPGGASKLSTTPPKGSPGLIDQPALSPLSAEHKVDLARFTVVDRTPNSVLNWFAAHALPHATFVASGGTSGPGGSESGDLWTLPLTAIFRVRVYIVSDTALKSGGTLVRIDSWVAYIPNRSATEVIPGGVNRVELSVLGPTGSWKAFEITSSKSIAALVQAVNGLPRPYLYDRINPDWPLLRPTRLTPAEARELVVARFFVAGRASPVATIRDHPAYESRDVGNVGFFLGTKRGDLLQDTRWVVAAEVERLTGVHFVGWGAPK
jgi:hypothetical protein